MLGLLSSFGSFDFGDVCKSTGDGNAFMLVNLAMLDIMLNSHIFYQYVHKLGAFHLAEYFFEF